MKDLDSFKNKLERYRQKEITLSIELCWETVDGNFLWICNYCGKKFITDTLKEVFEVILKRRKKANVQFKYNDSCDK